MWQEGPLCANKYPIATGQQGLIVVRLHHLVQQQQQIITDRCPFWDSSLLPLVCLTRMPAPSSYDCFFGVDALIGSVWIKKSTVMYCNKM
jgi:hypothetical protein